jgi:transposase
VNNETKTLPSDLPSAHFVINELTLKNENLLHKNQELQERVDWFTRQLFGKKSEKLLSAESGKARQLSLGEVLEDKTRAEAPAANTTIKEHVRRKRGKAALEDDCGETGLRFDSSVPVEEIACPPVGVEGLKPDEYEVVSTKTTERLCQRSSYYVKRYLRPVVKIKETGELHSTSAPDTVFESSYADVSLLAGICIDKIQYHIPLYRQHLRLSQAGVMIARTNLTSWLLRTANLLEPIYKAVLASVLKSAVLAMDESPMKAGLSKKKKGSMHQGYVWALFGDKNEAAFLYSETRALKAVQDLVKEFCGTLITDGYTVYEKMAAMHTDIEHALCWAHTRREFFQALDYEPEKSEEALSFIQKLYEVEAAIREKNLDGEKKRDYRVEHARDVVDSFFTWLKEKQQAASLLPSNKFTKACSYALKREAGLRVYLTNPDVPIDTNHLEREIRPIPMGRKNWLFCWTEVGADAIAILQTLISCCKLEGIDPSQYLIDVLQKVDSHSSRKVHELTPRLWKKTALEEGKIKMTGPTEI